ncbi:MAG: permease-like cell division protein FtsX [Muribaculaceae bacterium]|nr:permease-like cell division protein FtsX [Muribaculaceae bacterium]
MRISTLFYTLRQGFRNIFRNKWFTLASIATISACLFLFGLFYAIVTNFQHMVKTAEREVGITVFFEKGIDDVRIQEIGTIIGKRTEVSEIHFVTAEEAWESFKGDYLENYEDGFTENPLETSFHYVVHLNDVSMQSALVTYVESIDGVDHVNYSALMANTLTGFNALIAYVSIGIIAILFAVSVFLISNTVMIGISVRKEEINIMKYIGATDFFVRSPFVIEGMLIGLIGAAIPLGAIYVLYNMAMTYILERFPTLTKLLVFLDVKEIFHVLLPVSLGIGVGIGFLGSIVTVRKHLRV